MMLYSGDINQKVNSQSNFHSGNYDRTYIEKDFVVELSLGNVFPERRPEIWQKRLTKKGTPLNKQSFYEIDRIISDGLDNGQHIYQIAFLHV